MSSFYTSVEKHGNFILWRGYENGVSFIRKVKYQPTLYLQTNDKNSGYNALINGSNLTPKKFDTMYAAKEYIESFKDVHGYPIAGNSNFVAQFIQEYYPDDIKFDMSDINTMSFDIEVDISEGYPDMDLADKAITSIAMKSSKTDTYNLLGLKDYDKTKTITGVDPDNIQFTKFDTEESLLRRFVQIWTSRFPDIVTGWNCIPVGQSVWGVDRIHTIENCPDALFESNKKLSSPISSKQNHEIKLASGRSVFASKDHKFFVRECPKDRYTKLKIGGKSLSSDTVKTVGDMMVSDNTMFVPVPMRKNENPCNEKYSNEQLYLAGLIFTDGSLKSKYNPSYGYNIYQKSREFLLDLGVNENIYGNDVKGHSVYVNPSNTGEAHNLIYKDAKKSLDVSELSSLSEVQFYAFLSGMLDGDGCYCENRISICNFDGHIAPIAELLQWNGVFSTIHANGNMLNLIDIDVSKLITNHKRFDGAFKKVIDRDSSAKSDMIRFKKIDDVYYVRVDSVTPTGEYVDMMDIETDNHSFVSMGVRVHNCEYFDVQYIVTRIIAVLGETKAKELSPWGMLHKKTREIFNKEQSTFKILGMTVIDYMDAFKKFGFKYGTQESYKLDHIAYVVLGEKKLDYSEYGSLTGLYEKNPQLYLDYNLQDTRLVVRFEEETALMSLVLTVAYTGGVNYTDAFGTVGIWDTTIYRKLMKEKIVPPIKGEAGKRSNDLVGGYVKAPIIGMYDWVVSFDLNSLYPHLMLQYNMSPETLMSHLRTSVSLDAVLNGEYQNDNPDVSVAANGVCFSNAKMGIIPQIITEYYANRSIIKKEMLKTEQEAELEKDPKKKKALKRLITQLHNSQMAIKIAMNSLYGATANPYFIYYIAEMAEAITTSGQMSILCGQKSVNDYMNKVLGTTDVDYIVYIDTDSIYVNFAPLIQKVFGTLDITNEEGEKFLDTVCKEKVNEVIREGYEKLAKNMGAYRNAMAMDREKITNKAVFVAKKRYILNTLNSEGVHYEEPKISVTGIESVRSSTPEVCRNKLKASFGVLMNGSEQDVQEFIEEFRQEFFKLPVEDIAKISGTNDIDAYSDPAMIYRKGCPMHVRGCLVYNNRLKELGLENRYETIKSGDKIKFIYLKLPNTVKENIISFPNVLPKEFELDKYVSHQLQFEKVFLNPLKTILDAVGWESSKRNTIESFFS